MSVHASDGELRRCGLRGMRQSLGCGTISDGTAIIVIVEHVLNDNTTLCILSLETRRVRIRSRINCISVIEHLGDAAGPRRYSSA